jgi:preprotein translocase subunit SecE
MADQATSSTETAQTGENDNIEVMMFQLMKEMCGQFQDIREEMEKIEGNSRKCANSSVRK